MIKTHQSHHKTKFLITCNNPRIASTKTQSNFCNKMSFAKDKIQKRRTFHDIKLRYLSFQIFVSKTLNLWKQPKGHEISRKLSRKKWQVINFSPLSFQNSSKNSLKPKLSSTDFYIWYLKLTSRFKTRTLKLAFSKFQPWSNMKVKITYKSKVYTCNKALKLLPQILFCLLTTPYSHGNVVVQKKGY